MIFMTTKKVGKIIMLSTIPHFLLWCIFAAINELPNGHPPYSYLWWVLSILLIGIIGAYMVEEATPIDTWKSIIKYINE